jgi:hypothetical protein
MLIRTLDGTGLSAVANREDTRPYLGGKGDIDLIPMISNPENFALVDEIGGYVFYRLYENTYEGHTIYPPEASYKMKWRGVMDAFDYMFTRTDCEEIVTKCPDNNPGAGAMAEKLGFHKMWRREKAWDDEFGVSYRNLPLDRWADLCSTAGEWGRQFHSMIDEAKQARKSVLPEHPEDTTHDHIVGASIMMARRGQVVKGVNFYNRWAMFAGYGPVKMLSEAPVVIDAGEGVIVGIEHDHMEVLQCP